MHRSKFDSVRLTQDSTVNNDPLDCKSMMEKSQLPAQIFSEIMSQSHDVDAFLATVSTIPQKD